MLRSTIFALALTFAAQPAAGAPRPPVAAEHDGYRFELRSELQHDGSTIRISGTMLDTGDRFKLTLWANGLVQGRVGQWPVSYYVTRAARDRVAAQIEGRDLAPFAAAAKDSLTD